MPGLMDMVKGLLGGKASNTPAKVGHQSFLSLLNGDLGFETMAKVLALIPAAGAWQRIWEYTCPAQTALAWGYGTPSLPDNQGYLWFAVMKDGTDFSVGLVRLGMENFSRHTYVPVIEMSDTQLHDTDNTDITTARLIDKKSMIALPERPDLPAIGQDSRLTIDYRTVTASAGADDADFAIPITVYN